MMQNHDQRRQTAEGVEFDIARLCCRSVIGWRVDRAHHRAWPVLEWVRLEGILIMIRGPYDTRRTRCGASTLLRLPGLPRLPKQIKTPRRQRAFVLDRSVEHHALELRNGNRMGHQI